MRQPWDTAHNLENSGSTHVAAQPHMPPALIDLLELRDLLLESSRGAGCGMAPTMTRGKLNRRFE